MLGWFSVGMLAAIGQKQGFRTVAEHNMNRLDGNPRHANKQATRFKGNGRSQPESDS
jgi:hypothetical protein